MMLNVNVECGSENKSYTALNDVAVTKADDCKIADFEVSKNGRLISSLRADGVILSTAHRLNSLFNVSRWTYNRT